MKKSGLLKLVVAVVVIFFLVRLCSQNFGSVITLPGGMGGSNSGGKTSDESGGWFSPKNQPGSTTTTTDPDIADLERELGVGSNRGKTTTTTPSTTTTTSTTSSSTPLSFKGIPMTGSSSAFGNELVRAGFRNNGNGTYTGTFAGYDGCKITPVGNPVQEVRVDFPVISNWDALEKSYDSLQASLTQKYGKEPRTSTNNNLAVYDLDNGTISLDADVQDKSTWHVILTYSNAPTLTMGTTTGGSAFDDL